MMATAFLGYKHSPKWQKQTNSTNSTNSRYSGKLHRKNNLDGIMGKRLYSTYHFDSKISKVVQNFLDEKNLKPTLLYEDLKNQDTKNSIKNDTGNLSGVYLVLNKITLDYYIGSASTNKFYTRFYRHLINLTGSKIVKLATRKYGIDSFAFMVLELFPERVSIENNKKLLDLEDFYIKSLLPNYNILTEAGSSFGYKHTELDRIKMKAIYSEERRNAIGNLNKCKIPSVETREKMKKSASDRLPLIYSERGLSNMKNNSKGIILYNVNSNTVYGEYDSITETAVSVNCNEKTIRRSLKTEKKILLRR